ncbi:DnaJ domain-containing protein [Planctomycetota bacterium]|jgi:DnaJ-domain-containing protein 1|nr:DnaJ domain-containing protein [Planctomycetota bacterium]
MIRRQRTTALHGSVTVLLAWVAGVDDTIDERESSVLGEAGLRQRPESNGLIKLGESKDLRSIALALSILSEETPDTKQGVLELCIAVALADRVLRYSEIHALSLVAEALGVRTPDGLDQAFRKMSGRPMPPLGDPSRRAHWSQGGSSDQGQRRSGREQRRDRKVPAGAGLRRIQALAALGLSGDPTRDEIKSAYRRLVKVHHPDKFAQLGPDATKAAEQVFLRLQSAYELLMP